MPPGLRPGLGPGLGPDPSVTSAALVPGLGLGLGPDPAATAAPLAPPRDICRERLVGMGFPAAAVDVVLDWSNLGKMSFDELLTRCLDFDGAAPAATAATNGDNADGNADGKAEINAQLNIGTQKPTQPHHEEENKIMKNKHSLPKVQQQNQQQKPVYASIFAKPTAGSVKNKINLKNARALHTAPRTTMPHATRHTHHTRTHAHTHIILSHAATHHYATHHHATHIILAHAATHHTAATPHFHQDTARGTTLPPSYIPTRDTFSFMK